MFGDIARKQGIQTARNWRKVKEGTTKGINDFANSDQMQFAQMMLPLPAGFEGAEAAIKSISKPVKEGVKKAIHIPDYGFDSDNIQKLNHKLKKAIDTGVLKMETPRKAILDKEEVVVLGDYYNPLWQTYYNNIMKPLDVSGKAVLPKNKPKMVLGKKYYDWAGLSFDRTKNSYVNLYGGNINTGVHEYLSHGTDDFVNPKDWENVYYSVTTPDVKKEIWQEQRSTLNEARFNMFRKLLQEKGDVKLPQLQEKIDNMTDDQILNASIFKNYDKFAEQTPQFYNGYSAKYYNYLRDNPQVMETIANKLRHHLKYMFGLTGVGLYDNKTNK